MAVNMKTKKVLTSKVSDSKKLNPLKYISIIPIRTLIFKPKLKSARPKNVINNFICGDIRIDCPKLILFFIRVQAIFIFMKSVNTK